MPYPVYLIIKNQLLRYSIQTILKRKDEYIIYENNIDDLPAHNSDYINELLVIDVAGYLCNENSSYLISRLENKKNAVIIIANANEQHIARHFIRQGGFDVFYLNQSESILLTKLTQATKKITNATVDNMIIKSDIFNTLQKLTKRELQILGFILEGYKTNEIAKALSINSTSVSSYKKRLILKLNVKNTTEIIRLSIEEKWQIN